MTALVPAELPHAKDMMIPGWVGLALSGIFIGQPIACRGRGIAAMRISLGGSVLEDGS